MTYPFSVHGDEFKDKRVLVTGGTKGMGAAMVKRFRISGARIATTARSEPVGSKEDVLFIKADISGLAGTNAVAERIDREWGGLDILVNNVGGTATKRGFTAREGAEQHCQLGNSAVAREEIVCWLARFYPDLQGVRNGRDLPPNATATSAERLAGLPVT
jgi:NAD(P)-dependent dehydrogenase (short-subunit alcohol dehydrogenase family)